MPKLLEQLDLDEDKTASKKEIKKKKQDVTKEKSSKTEEADDFDRVIQEFTQSNSICSFTGCKKSTKLIKLVCEFCKKWFCLEHGKLRLRKKFIIFQPQTQIKIIKFYYD